jgi:DNA-binding MarR family transcriptional regulator
VDETVSRTDVVAFFCSLGAVLHGLKRAQTEQEEIDHGAAIVLSVLYRHGPMRPSDIAQISSLDVSTVSRHARFQEEAGRVVKVADPVDRRAHRLALTEVGIERTDALWTRRIDQLAELMGHWTLDETRTFTALSDRLAADLGVKVPIEMPDPDTVRATHQAAIAETLPKGA